MSLGGGKKIMLHHNTLLSDDRHKHQPKLKVIIFKM